jgi:hypothetical protein
VEFATAAKARLVLDPGSIAAAAPSRKWLALDDVALAVALAVALPTFCSCSSPEDVALMDALPVAFAS